MTDESSIEKTFGACFVGPPGSGKTTCLKTLKEAMEKNKRNVIIVNLDPANELLPFHANFDVCKTITVSQVMHEYNLGPNGALRYIMDSLYESRNEIKVSLNQVISNYTFVLFDLPGQVELYTHGDSVRLLLQFFQDTFKMVLVCVNLTDKHLCSTKDGLLGQSLMSTAMMLNLHVPFINFISKFDLDVKLNFNPLNFSFEDFVSSGIPPRLHVLIVELLSGFDLVSYSLFSIYDETTVVEMIRLIDKSVGSSFML